MFGALDFGGLFSFYMIFRLLCERIGFYSGHSEDEGTRHLGPLEPIMRLFFLDLNGLKLSLLSALDQAVTKLVPRRPSLFRLTFAYISTGKSLDRSFTAYSLQESSN